MLRHALPILLGAVLTFLVQPIVARFLLPWFGGGNLVWAVALTFFQIALFGGYLWAHALGRLAPRLQVGLHFGCLALAWFALDLAPGSTERPVAGSEPFGPLLTLLARHVGLPFVLLTATTPLVSRWYARTAGERAWVLYAVSNAGALGALLCYPFLVEPSLGRTAQVSVWQVGFGLFVLSLVPAAVSFGRTAPQVEPAGAAVRIPIGRRVCWLALSATGSALLLAVTNQLTQDVAPVPLLWVLPLAVYLASFVAAFGFGGRLGRVPLLVAATLSTGLASYLLYQASGTLGLPLRLGLWLLVLGVATLGLHTELYRARPDARGLTGFYLHLAAGGALGGSAVSIVAPRVFDTVLETHVGLALMLLLLGLPLVLPPATRSRRLALGAVWLLLIGSFATQEHLRRAGAVFLARNAYGSQVVSEVNADDPPNHRFELYSSTTLHGEQYVAEERRRFPTTFFTPSSGAGLAFLRLVPDPPRRVGVVGLGAGVLAAYGLAGDRFSFYELDPLTERIARERFTFLADSAAEIEVVLGDARLTLEAEPPQAYDLFVLDAFAGDAVPVHLLTTECLELYLSHLAPDGLLVLHVSNQFLDLVAVLAAAALELELEGRWLWRDKGVDGLGLSSTWVLLARAGSAGAARLRAPGLVAVTDALGAVAAGPLWTDERAALFEALYD